MVIALLPLPGNLCTISRRRKFGEEVNDCLSTGSLTRCAAGGVVRTKTSARGGDMKKMIVLPSF